jgi:hydroxyethylthiazole kinase
MEKIALTDLAGAAAFALERVRGERPLIHAITNFVTMNDVANAVLAVGARPVMAHALEEVEEIATSAHALVLNLGTPSPKRIEAMRLAGHAANVHAVPVVFDPVGVAASHYRANAATRLLDHVRVTILRGNATDVGKVAGIWACCSHS